MMKENPIIIQPHFIYFNTAITFQAPTLLQSAHL